MNPQFPAPAFQQGKDFQKGRFQNNSGNAFGTSQNFSGNFTHNAQNPAPANLSIGHVSAQPSFGTQQSAFGQQPLGNQNNSFANTQSAFSIPQSAFPSQQSAFTNQQSAFSNQQTAFQNRQGPFHNEQNAFPSQHSVFANQKNVFPSQQSAFSSQHGSFPSQSSTGQSSTFSNVPLNGFPQTGKDAKNHKSAAASGTEKTKINEFQLQRANKPQKSSASKSASDNNAVSAQQPSKSVKFAFQSDEPRNQPQLPEPDNKASKNKKKESKKSKRTKQKEAPLVLPKFAPTHFVDRRRPKSNDIAISKPLPKPSTSVDFQPDPWDLQNQALMESVESDYLSNKLSLQSAYDALMAMHKEERLEMEKRGLVDSTEHRKDLSEATIFIGTCADMCPVFERVRRAYENNILNLEKDSNGRANRELAIKAFSRPAAGQPPPLPSDVRPPEVLVKTSQYLVTAILPKLPQSHASLWDRTRSIRQDFTYQNYQGPEAIYCSEVIARLHCCSLHIMARSAAVDGAEWSQQQELEQFNKCLQSLGEFYQTTPSAYEPEMYSYHLMSQFFDNELLASIDRLRPEVSRHSSVNLAVESRTLAQTSIPLFFERIRRSDVPATMRAIAEVHFNDIRIRMIRRMVASLNRRMRLYPSQRFSKMLGFETLDEARRFCDFYDVNISVIEDDEEVVDMNTWLESNVKDKQQMPQAFDTSLDRAIQSFNVLQPVGPPIPLMQPKDDNMHEPKVANPVKAPPFITRPVVVPTPSPRPPAPEQRETVPASKQKIIENDAETIKRKKQESLLRQQEAQKRKEEERRRIEEKARAEQEAQRARELALLEKQKQEEALRRKQASEEEQRQLRQKEFEEQKFRELELERKEAFKRQQEHARLQQLRSEFVAKVSHCLFDSLIQKGPSKDAELLIKSTALGDRLLAKVICHKIKSVSKCSLDSQRERQIRLQELELFREKRGRVVSHRKRKNETSVVTNRWDESLLSPSADKPLSTVTSSSAEISSAYNSDQDGDESQSFDFSAVKESLAKALSCGLRELVVSCDPNTRQGSWLCKALGIGRPIEVFPGEYLDITMYPSTDSMVQIIGAGGDVLTPAHISRTFTETSLHDLALTLDSSFDQYVESQIAVLSSLRSLTHKRRRLALASSSDTSSRPYETPSQREETTVKPELTAQDRLRQAIESARRLVQEP